MTIKGATTKVLSANLGGAPVAALKDWFDFAKGQKNVIATTDHGISGVELNSEDVSISPVLLALSEGFTVEGAPIWIKMDTDAYAGEVPVGISNRSYTLIPEEGEPQTIVRNWADWHDATHEHMDAADGDVLVAGNSWGSELASAELTVLLGAGYTLLLNHEVAAHLPEEE
jgi:hypothetical protein